MMIGDLGLGVGGRGDAAGLALGHRLSRLGQALKIELVGVPLAVHLLHDVLVVVVPECPRQLVVVHVGFALSFAPLSGDLIRVEQLELAVPALPADAGRVGLVGQQLEQELPQLNLTRATVDGGQLVVVLMVMVLMVMVAMMMWMRVLRVVRVVGVVLVVPVSGGGRDHCAARDDAAGAT